MSTNNAILTILVRGTGSQPLKKLLRAPKGSTLPAVALGAALLLALMVGAMAHVPSSPRDKLAAWTGHWRVRIETRETQFGHARTEYFDSRCSFFPHGTFVFCDYLALQRDAESGRVVDDVALVYYSDVDKTFKYTNVAEEGGPREDRMQVDGNVWTRPFAIPRRSGGQVNARETYDFVSPDKQLARLELSTDGGAHWTVVNTAVGTRVH